MISRMFEKSPRRSRILFGIAAVVIALATSLWLVRGGLGGRPAPQESKPIGTPEVPGSCTKQTATRLVEDFFARWNDYDVSGVAGLFSSGVSFHDNVGGKQATLTGHDALRRYLADRFVLGDQFSNVVADIPENPSPARANPTVSFVRSVGAAMYRGNAKLVCADDLLRDVVMSAR